MKKVVLVLNFLVIFCSCNKDKYDYSLVEVGSIAIPIDETISQTIGSIGFLEHEGRSMFLTLNRDRENHLNEMLFFDIEAEKLDKKFPFSDDRGFYKSVHGFNFIGKDSLILGNGLTDTLYISDLQGKIKFKKHFKFETPEFYLSQLVPNKSEPMAFYNNQLFFTPMHLYAKNKEDFKSKYFIFSYDFAKDSVIPLSVHFPESYINSEVFSPFLNYTFDGQNMVYSPLNSHDLWVVDLKTHQMKIVKAKSDHFRKFLKFTGKPQESMTQGMYDNAHYSQYMQVIYDKSRKVYYRLFFAGVDIDIDSEDLSMEYENPKVMCIIILDENFNKIGEDIFPNHDFMPTYFVAPDGLYISSDNAFNKNYDEDHLTFTKLRLKHEKR